MGCATKTPPSGGDGGVLESPSFSGLGNSLPTHSAQKYQAPSSDRAETGGAP
jgi:hypothetical protein